MFLRINFTDPKFSNSVRVTARYALSPHEIRYEVIDGHGKGRIKNSIGIKEPSNHAIQQGCKCEIEVNHLPLDIINVGPHGLEESDPMYEEYYRKGLYLQTQDQIYLEGNSSLQKIVTKCPKCGSDSLALTGPIETVGGKRTLTFECKRCDMKASSLSVGKSDGLDFVR